MERLGASPAVVDLLLSDDDDDKGVSTSNVARMPRRRRRRPDPEGMAHGSSPRKRDPEEMITIVDDDDDDDEVQVVARPRTPSAARPRNKRARLKTDNSNSNSNDEVKIIKTKAGNPLPLTPLEQVLELFPDVELAHAQKLLKEHANVPANVVNALLEAGSSYPKEPAKAGSQKTGAATWNICSDNDKKDEATPSFDFMSTSSFQTSQEYWVEATQRLVYDFPCLTLTGARFFLGKTEHHYAPAHDKIVRAITGKDDKKLNATLGEEAEEIHYKKLISIMPLNNGIGKLDRARLDKDQKDRLDALFQCQSKDTLFSKKPKEKPAPVITVPLLRREIAYVENKLSTWKQSVQLGMKQRAKRKTCIENGTAVDCGCCYEQFALEEMKYCRDGHLFCRGCLSSYVENQVFANGHFGVHPQTKERNLELVCFHGDGCTTGFEPSVLASSLTPAVMKKLDELQTRVALTKAGLDQSLCTCPKCGFSAEVAETQNVFACLSCGFESCRHCREASHIPLRCDEVEKENETKGRARVEEAASAAFIRQCPKCKKGVIKSDGCNKMTCACGSKWCYLCCTVVKDYTHFCQKPHCQHPTPKACNYKCPLYTKDAEEDAKRIREAATAEAKRVEEEMKGADTTKKAGLFAQDDEKKPAAKPTNVRIDVESIIGR